jgi:deoxyribose-phosphate aldolase
MDHMNKQIDSRKIEIESARLLNDFLNKTAPDFPFREKELAFLIDHTLLKPEATDSDVIKVCDEAKKYSFASVCINPSFVRLCKKELENSTVKVCTVIGFPLGSNSTEVKKFEAVQALQNGAQEIDMVINVGKLKQKDYQYVYEDIKAVTEAAQQFNCLSKVIIETALLTDEEKVKACLIAKEAEAGFVKTSTGFSKSGATASDVALMRFVVGREIGVKASGGIRTIEDAQRMVESGANRIGASASVQIINEIKSEKTGF